METATPTPTTSASATPAPVSTPTSGATTTTVSAAPTPAERPKTMAEAFAKDAALHATDATTQPEGATTPPVEGIDPQSATPLSTDAKTGPIPFEAHKTALENARTKAASEATAAFDRDFGWAKQPGARESVEKFGAIAGQMTSDPVGFAMRFISELQANPVHAAALRSNAGRMLATKQANAEPQPDVQIVDATGQVTGTTYSSAQLAKRDAWNKAQLLAEVQKEFGPLKTERDQRQAQQKAEETTRQVNAKADEVMSEVTDILDGNKALLSEVSKLMDANPTWTAHKAALEVRKTKIAPALAGKAQADVLETLKTKAASQAVNPAGAVVAATSRPKSFLDKSLKW
jgi:hypothetical protein